MVQKKPHPSSVHSKKQLTAALFTLMENCDYPQITISEITAHAGLNRRTFYRNFKTKEDILIFSFEELCRSYVEALKKELPLSLPKITKTFFTLCQTRLDYLRLLQKNNLLPFLLDQFNVYLPQIYPLVKGAEQRENGNPGNRQGKPESNEYGDSVNLEYLLAYSVGGFWNMMVHWLSQGATQSPDDLAAMITKGIHVHFQSIHSS